MCGHGARDLVRHVRQGSSEARPIACITFGPLCADDRVPGATEHRHRARDTRHRAHGVGHGARAGGNANPAAPAARNLGNSSRNRGNVPFVNRTFEWGVSIATCLSVLSVVPRHCSRLGAFSHSAGTAPIITVIIQVTILKTTHLRNHAQSIQISKIQTSDACHGSQGPKFCPL